MVLSFQPAIDKISVKTDTNWRCHIYITSASVYLFPLAWTAGKKSRNSTNKNIKVPTLIVKYKN